MIDLNKYYVSSEYQGASAGNPGRSGYVPQALSGDELKFLRGDGTWQMVTGGGTDLLTVTNYLSTNNILLSAATITTNISAQGLVYSKSITPNLPMPKITLMGANQIRGTTLIEYVTGGPDTEWGVGGQITLTNAPYLVVSDFTQEDLNNNQIFIEMVIFKKKKGSISSDSKEGSLSYRVPIGNAVRPWGSGFWQRSGDLTENSSQPQSVITRYNHLPVTTLNETIPLSNCLNGHFKIRNISYLDPTSVDTGDTRTVNCLVPFGSNNMFGGRDNNRMKFAYSRALKPLYIAFRYICWLPNNNNGRGQIISGPLSPTIRLSNLHFPFDVNAYQSSLKGFPVYDLNPFFETFKTFFKCKFC